MKKLDVSPISTTAFMPVKEGTWLHLQAAYQEAIDAIAQNVIGPNYALNTVYILYGCKNTGTGLNFIISAGAVYYNGEVYLVPASTFTAPGGQTAIANISIDNYVSGTIADPVLFTDGNQHNIHNIRLVKIAAGVSGNGIADFLNFKQSQLILQVKAAEVMANPYSIKFDGDYSLFFGTLAIDANFNFDFTNAIPGAVITAKFTFGAGRNFSVGTPTGSQIVKDSGDASQVSNNTNTVYFIYMGVNDQGKNEVRYTLKQTA
jgi:hypothetical protein